jgi:environmental stress-induced protein Ves
MIRFQSISRSSYRRSTWKNGLGYTDEIAIHPPGSDLRRGDFLWRLSSAQIAQASPFSVFPHHDRILVILSGAGVRLFHRFDEQDPEEERVELPTMNAYEFPGDIQSRCELIDGTVTDFSIFIRKAEAEAMVDTIQLRSDEPYPWTPNGRWNFIFAAQGGIQLRTPSQVFEIENGDCLLAERLAPGSHDANPDANPDTNDDAFELTSQEDSAVLAVSIS